jgi:threonylcarbamoyladenosine tRNA methylthiotransferase MtaB
LKIAVETLGCKLNQAETESLIWELAASGHQVVTDVGEAHVYILNTCTVTGNADAKARQRLRRAHQRNPNAFIIATGCYAERDPGKLSTMAGVRLVVPNSDKPRLVSLIQDRLESAPECCSSTILPESLRTRAFIKVQDGCGGACAYCIVPQVRRMESSVAPADVLSTIRNRLARGVKEVVITGTEVGSYRSRGCGLKDLLKMILEDTKVPRLRLSSLQPAEISDDLLSLWTDRRLCPHFHLSIQSGSDSILRSMRRRYSVRQYVEAVSRIRGAVPDVAITTDVIVGFPGETENLFEENYRTCQETKFARIHVFPYSPRPGTEAASLSDVVDERTKRRRTGKMLSVAEESASNFRATFRGRSRPVLWEQSDGDDLWSGFTDNYIPVKCRSRADISNTVTPFIVD